MQHDTIVWDEDMNKSTQSTMHQDTIGCSTQSTMPQDRDEDDMRSIMDQDWTLGEHDSTRSTVKDR